MVNSISLLAVASLATTASADLTSVFSKVTGIERAIVNAVPHRSLDAAPTYDSVNKEFTPYDTAKTLGAVTECVYASGEPGNEKAKEGDKVVPGVWGLEWDDSLQLVSKCVSNEEICEDLSHELCSTFYKEAKTLMTLLGWDGKTTLQAVYDQVKDSVGDDQIDVTVNDDESVSIEGYNLNVYRIGDICPVSAKMCDEEVTATFVFESADSAVTLQEELIRQACVGAGRGFWEVGSTAVHTKPDLAKCKYQIPTDARRRLASNEVSLQGSLTGMNQLLAAMVDSDSAVSQLAANPAMGQNLVTPDAEYTTDKETNEGGALDLLTLAIIVLAVLLCICCCCLFCCCRYVCKCCCTPAVKRGEDSMSHMQMTAVVN